jgi:hypothetical protein
MKVCFLQTGGLVHKYSASPHIHPRTEPGDITSWQTLTQAELDFIGGFFRTPFIPDSYWTEQKSRAIRPLAADISAK